jgi:acyl-CoA reductase-like NAD-dependent aldehyde dehydrogenase
VRLMQVFDPSDGSLVAELEQDEPATVREKAQRACRAQPAWAAMPLPRRLAAIGKFRELLVTRRDELAAVLSTEMGKPIRQAQNELKGVLDRIDFFTTNVRAELDWRTVHHADGLSETISQEPLGVVANISAWNYPYFVGANVFVPALLTGNAVLYKPSEFATLTGIEIGRMMHEAGVPPEVFTVVVGASETGKSLISQDVDGVFFTGSYATGCRIAAAVGARMVRLQLELGGKDPVYVCDDAPVATAAASIADGAFYNAGQSCCAVERIYVHETVHDAFIEAFVAEVKGFQVGHPLSPNTYIGPLARSGQIDLLEAQVADARAKGAKVLHGGSRITGCGNYFQPTVLVDVDHTMALMREESFGPVIGIQRVWGDVEAVRLMNDTQYGLTAGVYTPDRQRALSLLAQVRSGSAYWNCCDRVSPRLPWSGHRHSGMGLTLSTYGIQAFTRPRAWHLRAA